MTRKARLITDKDKTISVIDDRLYGSFIEHLEEQSTTAYTNPDTPVLMKTDSARTSSVL